MGSVRHPSIGKRARQDSRRFGAILAIPDHYLLRSLPGQLASALRIEADRLAQRGRARFGPANFIVAMTSAQVVIGLGLGPRALIAYLTQGAIAVVLLQAVNYLQHSGLERPEGAQGALAHSWQSDRVLGRFLHLELPRHADHHGHAANPYHALVSHDDSPTLPLGLLGTIPVLPILSLWFTLERKRVARMGDSQPHGLHGVHHLRRRHARNEVRHGLPCGRGRDPA